MQKLDSNFSYFTYLLTSVCLVPIQCAIFITVSLSSPPMGLDDRLDFDGKKAKDKCWGEDKLL